MIGGRWARRWLAALVVLGAVPGRIGPATPPPTDPPGALLLTIAEVAPTRAVLWVRAAGSPTVTVRYAAAAGPWRIRTASPRSGRDWTVAVELQNLAPATRYRYVVEAGEQRGGGAFSTAPASHADVPARLAWSGDLGGAGHCRDVEDGYPIFRTLIERGPDFFLFVGDTIYADHACGRTAHVAGPDRAVATLAGFYAKHRYNRADPSLQAFFRSTPVYAIWDDHEVRNNFAGPDEPLMPAGRQAFQDYFGIAGAPDEPGRLYRRVRWGRHLELFILDTRQYRSGNTERDGHDKTMLGAAQRRWLLDGVGASDATWKAIVTSVPLGIFTGGAASDSWSSANVLGYPRPGHGFVHERDLILGELARRRVTNVVFVSGDVHHAELIRYEPVRGYTVHEFLAGPLAARRGYPRFLDRSLTPQSLGSLGFASNFGELTADAAALEARIVDTAGAVRAAIRIPVASMLARRP